MNRDFVVSVYQKQGPPPHGFSVALSEDVVPNPETKEPMTVYLLLFKNSDYQTLSKNRQHFVDVARVTAIQLQNNKNKSHKEESNMKFVKKFRKSPVKENGISIKSMYKEWDKQRAAVENMGPSARAEIDAIFTREIGKHETLNK